MGLTEEPSETSVFLKPGRSGSTVKEQLVKYENKRLSVGGWLPDHQERTLLKKESCTFIKWDQLAKYFVKKYPWQGQEKTTRIAQSAACNIFDPERLVPMEELQQRSGHEELQGAARVVNEKGEEFSGVLRSLSREF